VSNFEIVESTEARELYNSWKVIGKPLPRADGRAKATGKALYPDDIRLPNALCGKILRSPYAHAKIKRIDTSKAKSLAGVNAIVTYKDVIELGLADTLISGTPFHVLHHTAFYVGDMVAGVAADNEAISEEALDLIEVDYEPLPFALTPEEASGQNALVLHPEFGTTNAMIPKIRRIPFKKTDGDIEEGFKEADIIVEREVKVPALKHMFIEQMNCVAEWRDTELYIWAACQSIDSRGLRQRMSTFFKMPMNRIQVYGCYLGGSFGGKQHGYHRLAAMAALLAKKANKPVKIRTNIREQLVQGNKHEIGPGIYKMKIGVKKNGEVTGLSGQVLAGEGAFLTTDIPVGLNFFGDNLYNYRAKNRQYGACPFYTNTLESGPLRGYGSQLANFAIETVVDEVAEAIGIDPIQFKVKNGLRAGDTVSLEPGVLCGGNMPDLVMKAAERFGWKEKWKGWGKPTFVRYSKRGGVGVALGTHGTGTGSAIVLSDTALVKICEDGTAEVSAGVVDMGSGLESSMCQVAAEILGLPYESVRQAPVDTRSNPNSFGQFDSRGLPTTVTAVYHAAQDARRKMLDNASKLLKAGLDKLDIDGERKIVYNRDKPKQAISIGALVLRLGQIVGIGIGAPAGPALAVYEPDKAIDRKTGLSYEERGLFVTLAEVEVDTDTGDVDVKNLMIGCETGMVINPKIGFGQALGAATFGMSMVLREGYIFDEMSGVPLNCSYTDYPIIRAVDIDENAFHILFLSDPALVPTVPFHAKGIAEGALVATLAAITNAVYTALGVRLRDFPLRPEKILQALEKIQMPETKGVI
jgi:xanthine dehydrogenase molybdenum-binding subunit